MFNNLDDDEEHQLENLEEGGGNGEKVANVILETEDDIKSTSSDELQRLFSFEDSKSSLNIPDGFSLFGSKAFEQPDYESFSGDTNMPLLEIPPPKVPDDLFKFSDRHPPPLSTTMAESKAFPVDVKTSLGYSSGSKLLVDDDLCPVCSDKVSGYHYGLQTCESCKGFFKRSVQNQKRYTCTENQSCPIDKTQRKRCAYCRFQKCLSVGMKLEAVRPDRMRGGRNKFGPIYRRDRAIRRQLLSKQNELMSNLQHLMPAVSSCHSQRPDLLPMERLLSPELPKPSNSPAFLGSRADGFAFTSDEMDIKPPIELLSGLVNSGIQSQNTCLFSTSMTSPLSAFGSRADRVGSCHRLPTSRLPLTTASSKINVASCGSSSSKLLDSSHLQSSSSESHDYMRRYEGTKFSKGMNQFMGLTDMAATITTQFITHCRSQSSESSTQPLYHVSQGYTHPLVPSSSCDATLCLPVAGGSYLTGTSRSPQALSGELSYPGSYPLQVVDTKSPEAGRRYTPARDNVLPSDISGIPHGSIQPGLFQLIVNLQKNDQRLRDSHQKLRRTSEELLQQLATAVSQLEQNPTNEAPVRDFDDQITDLMIEVFCKLCDHSLFVLVNWARRAHLFQEIVVEDQMKLLESCWSELLLLELVYCQLDYLSEANHLIMVTGHVVNITILDRLGLRSIADQVFELVRKFRYLRLDKNEYTCLKFIVLLNPDVPGLLHSDIVDQFRSDVSTVLLDYCNMFNIENDKFGQLLLQLSEIKVVSLLIETYLYHQLLLGHMTSSNLLIEMLSSSRE